MMTQTNEPTDSTIENTEGKTKLPKSATITLTAHGTTMAIVAERKGDGARTYVITTGADKKSVRGLTESHATFEAAKKHTENWPRTQRNSDGSADRLARVSLPRPMRSPPCRQLRQHPRPRSSTAVHSGSERQPRSRLSGKG